MWRTCGARSRSSTTSCARSGARSSAPRPTGRTRRTTMALPPVQAALRAPGELLDRVRQDVERNALRARNGVKLAAGLDRPRLGQSPRDLVWSRGRCQLWRYRSDQVTLAPPLLLV